MTGTEFNVERQPTLPLRLIQELILMCARNPLEAEMASNQLLDTPGLARVISLAFTIHKS